MADVPNPLRQSATDVVADKFANLLDGIEAEEAGQTAPAEAGQGEAEDPELGEAQDEPEPEPEDEVDPEAEEIEPETPTERKTRKVKDAQSGKEVEVDEDEAENGYLRLQDYTRKTQAAAQQRREAEALEVEAREKREAYSRKLEEASDWMNQMVPKEPDWATLKTSVSPAEYAEAHTRWQQFVAVKKTIETEKAKVDGERAKDFEKQVKSYVAAET